MTPPPPPPKHSSHTSLYATVDESGPKRTVLCNIQEYAPVCSGQCKSPKHPADSGIGQSPCDTSIPSDMRRPFIPATVLGETFNCAKRFAVVWEEGTAQGLFDKEPAPPPLEIQNSTAPPSTTGDPTEAGVFNGSNQEEDIALVRNQGLEVDDEMEPSPENFSLVYTTDYDTLF